MHKYLYAGLSLALAAVLTIVVGAGLGLEIESVAVLGLTAGAVVALVPDATPGRRLAAFALGFFVAVLGFFVRAAFMPDTSTGRAVTAGLVVALCVGVTLLAAGRLPLWAVLLGAATLVGGYETAFAAAPPRVVETSISTSTALLLCIGVGFLVTSIFAPPAVSETAPSSSRDEAPNTLDEMMEMAK